MKQQNPGDSQMTLIVLLVIGAIIFGGIGLFFEAAKWALIVAAVLLAAGALSSLLSRRGAGKHPTRH